MTATIVLVMIHTAQPIAVLGIDMVSPASVPINGKKTNDMKETTPIIA
jgi:hypothetical protein